MNVNYVKVYSDHLPVSFKKKTHWNTFDEKDKLKYRTTPCPLVKLCI